MHRAWGLEHRGKNGTAGKGGTSGKGSKKEETRQGAIGYRQWERQ